MLIILAIAVSTLICQRLLKEEGQKTLVCIIGIVICCLMAGGILMEIATISSVGLATATAFSMAVAIGAIQAITLEQIKC